MKNLDRVPSVEVVSPSYSRDLFQSSSFRSLVKHSLDKLELIMEKHPEIEALAACGHSGLMLMGALAYESGLPQIAVRKSLDTEHDDSMVNGWLGCKGYLIVDDLISSGKTVENMVEHITETHADYAEGGLIVTDTPKLVACMLYQFSLHGNENALWTVKAGRSRMAIPAYNVWVKGLEMPSINAHHYSAKVALD